MSSTPVPPTAPADTLADQAVELARRWVAESAEVDADPAAERLAGVLKDPKGLPFTIGFVDGVMRPESLAAAASNLSRVAPLVPRFLPWYLRGAVQVGGVVAPLLPSPVVPIARRVLREMVGHLVVDARPDKLGPAIAEIRESGAKLNLNLLGEAVLGEKEARRRLDGIHDLIRRPDVDYVSVKVSAIASHISMWAFEDVVDTVVERLLPLYLTAADPAPGEESPTGPTFINLDMEEYRDLDLTIAVFTRILEDPRLRNLEAGIVLQAYLPDALPALQQLTAWATERVQAGGARIKVRLVKGANSRSADVRAADAAVCQRWDRAQLLRILEQDALFASGFYRVLARLVSDRARQVTTNAVSGGLSRTNTQGSGNEAASDAGRALAQELTGRLMTLEPLIRRDRELARRETHTALHNFGERITEALGRLSEADQREAGRAIARELHPYVVRSHLGELALDRPSGHVADPLALAHIDTDRPEGDGPLGEFLDAWLLSLPSARALRERRALAAQAILAALPAGAPVRILLVNVGSGAILAALSPYLDRLRGEVTCVDGSRESLAAVDALLRKRPPDLKMRLVHEELAAVALGLARVRHPPQDVVVVEGLLDYLPERVAASLLGWAFGQLAPGGWLVATAMLPAPDDAVFRFLIEWPMVRRTRLALTSLLTNVGFSEVAAWEAASAGIVLRARTPRPDPTFHLLADLETEA